MSKTPPAPPSLEVLRKEIDAIDEQVHGLLMARGDIIDRLISVKKTQEVGSAFRPAREADMMRRLVQRHRGILPLDTVESIWRVIISTFTYVQAPFSVHADISLGESAMRDSARFHFGFTVPYVSHFSATAAVEAVANSKGDLALVSATSSRTPWWIALEASGAPKIIARLPDDAAMRANRTVRPANAFKISARRIFVIENRVCKIERHRKLLCAEQCQNDLIMSSA